jgi:drug/metabolite transporter (DMT)-like permease
MSALAIALVLISALFHALRSLFTKESGDKQIFLWLYSIFALLFYSPLFFYFLCRVGITHPVAYAWCVGSGFIHFIYWLFLTNSYKKGDLSHVYPSYIVGLRQTSIVFAVLMGSHFLKEKHKGIRLTGSLIIFAGGFLISLAR